VVPWREEEMVVACPPDHPLAPLQAIRPLRLAGEKYVAFDKGLVIRREIDRFLREQGVTVDVTLEFDNIENIKKGIEIGAGLGILPEPTLRQELHAGTLRALHLEGCRLVRPLGIIHRRQQLNSAARGFIELLRTTTYPAAPGETTNGTAPHNPRNGETGQPDTEKPAHGTKGARTRRIKT